MAFVVTVERKLQMAIDIKIRIISSSSGNAVIHIDP